MGFMDSAKDKIQDAGDSIEDAKNNLDNKAHEKKGEAQGHIDQADYDADNNNN
jgi:hypothetical protein